MAERPALYRAFRLGDAAALLAGAGALLVGTGALAAHTEVHRAADPSAVGSDLAYQRSNGAGVLRHGGAVTGLGGQQPALGGSYVAVAHAGHVEVRRRSHPGKTIAAMPARGVEALAVSDGWLAVLQNRKNRDVLFARRIGSDGQLGNVKRITRASHPSRLGHPSLDGGSLVYSVAKLRRSTIALRHLNSGKGRRLDSARRAQLLGPSIQNGHVLFVAAHRMRESSQETQAPTFVQRLVVKSIKGKGGSNTIYRRSGGGKILWTTALTPGRAYATLLAGHSERIISIRR
jgi:hypothetical protein